MIKKAKTEKKKSIGGDRAGKKKWGPHEDKLVISILQEDPHLKFDEVHKKFNEKKKIEWENRSLRGIKGRVGKLRLLGKIPYRNRPFRILKCPHCGGTFKITGKTNE